MLSVSPLPLSLAFLLSVIISDVFAGPAPTIASPSGLSMNLMRRSSPSRTPDEWGLWARNHHDMLIARYGGRQVERRGSGTNLLVNQNFDSGFYGSVAIGTPPVSYNVILDTGSADLWVASSSCQAGCGGVATFNAGASSTFSDTNTSFRITYGSGDASGTLGSDTVQMAGFSVSNQIFALCDVFDNVVDDPVSGILGLAFQTISASGATPFWETLVKNGAWDSPVMSFQLSRYIDDQNADSLEPGGTFTMGFVNTSLFTGDIDYNDVPANNVGFWMQTISSVISQGKSITLGTGADILAAIDTGTTNVGGPPQYIAEIYAQIPGSAHGTGNYENYYTYPCSTTVNVTMAFGGRSWAVSNANFQLTKLNNNLCLGAFFQLTTGSSPSWIIGDTFLKNVYTVFQYKPPAVGFAELSNYAASLNDVNNVAVPSATIGSVVAGVSATSGAKRVSNDASSRTRTTPGVFIVLAMLLHVVLS